MKRESPGRLTKTLLYLWLAVLHLWQKPKIENSSPDGFAGTAMGITIFEIKFPGFTMHRSRRVVQQTVKSRRKTRPPTNARFLFYLFMASESCDALVGDLEERYKLIHHEFGQRRANFWYWTAAICSVGPIWWAWAKKTALKPTLTVIAWIAARGLLSHDSWLAALVELYRKIRT